MHTGKKSIALLLAGLLFVSLLAGCSSSGTPSKSPDGNGNTALLLDQYPQFANANTLTIAAIEMGWTGPMEGQDIVSPEIARRTNLTFKYDPITVSTEDDMKQKLNLMIASKEVPDIYMGFSDAYTIEIYNRLGDNDLVWDLGAKIENYPNLYALLEPELNMHRTADGKNYFLPAQTGRGRDVVHSPPGGLYFRTDFLETLGMDYPTTPEEMYTYLVRCRDEIGGLDGKALLPLSIGENLGGIDWAFLVPFFSDFYKSDVQGLAFDADNSFKVVNQIYSDSDEMMRACKFLWKLYSEKLLDNEILTHKDAQFREKVSTGNVACVPGNPWDINAFTDAARAVVPDLEFVYSRIYDKANIPESKYMREWTNDIDMWSTFVVSKSVSEEAVDQFLATLDYFATKDGQLLIRMGVEGESYEYDADGFVKFTDDFKANTSDLDWNAMAGYGVGYLEQFVLNTPAYIDLVNEFPALEREDSRKSWEQDKHLTKYNPTMTPTPNYYFVSGPVENSKMSSLDDAKNQLLVKVMTAKDEAEVESLVRAYGQQCITLGIEDVVAERQAIVDELAAKLN